MLPQLDVERVLHDEKKPHHRDYRRCGHNIGPTRPCRRHCTSDSRITQERREHRPERPHTQRVQA